MPGNANPTLLPNEGTILSVTIATVPTPIGAILSVSPPGGEVTVVDKTALADTHKRKRPGLIPDSGEVSFRIQYDPNYSVHEYITGKINAPSLTNDVFKITYVDGMVVPAHDTFNGFFSKFEPADAEDESNLEADVTITIDGPVTRVLGAAS